MRTSDDWVRHFHLEGMIMDPDGWDRRDMANSWHELIDESEFRRRLLQSTIQYKSDHPFFKS